MNKTAKVAGMVFFVLSAFQASACSTETEKIQEIETQGCVNVEGDAQAAGKALSIKKACANKLKIKQHYKAKQLKVKKKGCLLLGNIGGETKCPEK